MSNVVYIADATLKVCNKCEQAKPTDKFPLRRSEFTGKSYRNPICRACRNATMNKWRQNNVTETRVAAAKKREARRSKARSENPVYHYRKKYGLTIEQKAAMLASQGGKCAICGTSEVTHKKGWCVDHCHKTNELRDILCAPCNTGIGLFKHNPTILRKAAEYMDQHLSKPFAWSYSRLRNYELCPRRYNEVDIQKNWPEEPSEQLVFGDAVHKAMAKALRNKQELPLEFQLYQPWVDKILRTKGELLVEDQCQWAIDRNFKPTPWFAKNVWLRCIADAVKIDDVVGLVVDFKTGKSSNADPIQLMLVSLMMFLQFPKLQCVRSDFIWLMEDDHTTQVLYRNEVADAWADILPRVKKLEQATIEDEFPPKPGQFCRSWCSVRSCEFHGR